MSRISWACRMDELAEAMAVPVLRVHDKACKTKGLAATQSKIGQAAKRRGTIVLFKLKRVTKEERNMGIFRCL